MLGEGAFGKVRLARSDATGHVVAVKVIKRDRINARAEELLRREVERSYLPYISPVSSLCLRRGVKRHERLHIPPHICSP